MPKRPQVVVDTNVPVTANGDASHASLQCEQACCDRLLEVTRGGILLVIDDGFEIFDEYKKRLSLNGQPRVGDVFFKWVHDNQFNAERCERVTLKADSSRGYELFPDDRDLADFDPDDRKYVAASRASTGNAPILNAVDSDWWDFQRVLRRNGVDVDFACDDQVQKWQKDRPQR